MEPLTQRIPVSLRIPKCMFGIVEKKNESFELS